MTEYTDEDVDALIRCPKRIVEPPRKKMREERGSLRNDMALASDNEDHEFQVFVRTNQRFPENFSIGLNFRRRQDREMICLLRCNGPHGPYQWGIGADAHFQYHIHRAQAENMRAGLRPERNGQPTAAYASYRAALIYFLGAVNVTNAEEYFSDLHQPSLFEIGDEG